MELYKVIIVSLMPIFVFSSECPERCYCTGMEIDCSDSEIMSVTQLEAIQGANIIDLSSNQIEEIPMDFEWTGIEQLQFLYLNANSIVYVAKGAFDPFMNLEYLDLSNNFLEVIPSRIIEENPRLSVLMLQGNVFGENVPILRSESLTNLDLSFCKLTHFSGNHVKYLPNLETLNLRVNNLLYFDTNIFAGKPLKSLELSFNIWACNCSTVELFQWISENQDVVEIQDFMCLSKDNFYLDLENISNSFRFKEKCNLDESYFKPSTLKNLSLVHDAFNIAVHQVISIPDSNKDYRLDEAFVVFVIMAVCIVCVAVFVGIIIGFYVARKTKIVQISRNMSLLGA